MRKRWIIGGVGLAVLLGAAYTGYWFWLARTVEQNLVLWVDEQRAMGYGLDYEAAQPGGFPFSIRIALSRVEIDSPSGQPSWRLSTAAKTLSIAPWAPLSILILDASESVPCHVRWIAGGRDYAVSMSGMDLMIRLSSDGALPAIKLSGKSADVTEDGGHILALSEPSGSVDFLPAQSDMQSSVQFQLTADGADFTPPSEPTVVKTSDWLVAGEVKGPVPLASLPAALTAWSSAGGHVELTRFSANWETATTVSGDGTVALDQRLQPVGAFSAVVRGYDEAVDAAVAHGLMTPAEGTAVKVWLAARAEKDERGLKVKLPLTIQDGFLSMGPVKLAQVPRLAWA